MFNVKDIWDALYRAHNTSASTDGEARQEEVRRECRKAYFELCSGTSWANMRASVAYSLTDNADGLWLPANTIGIDGVANTEDSWNKGQRPGALNANLQSRTWYIDEYNRTPLVSGTDLAIANGATTFTATGITAAMVGEYIRIDGRGDSHLLIAVNEIATPYYGTALTAGTFEVRPIGTQKIKLVTPTGLSDTGDPVIHIWQLPPQLYDETQVMELPTSALLELATKIKVFSIERDTDSKNGAQKDLYGSKGRYEGELSRARATNPEFMMPVRPKNWGGNNAGYGARPRCR